MTADASAARDAPPTAPARRRRLDWELDCLTRARTAVEQGDRDAALAAIDEIVAEERPIHDLYGDQTASFLTFIAERLGEEGVEDAWRYVAEDVWRPVLEQYAADRDSAGLAERFAAFLRSHRYRFQAWEDDERWSFEVQWCTSGERMLAEGKVRGEAGGDVGDPAGHHRFGATQAAYPWSFDHVGLPYYDVHAALWMRILPREWGWDVIDCEYAIKPGGWFAVTAYHVYKRPR